MDLPEVTEIQRLRFEPGDRLHVKVAQPLTPETARLVQEMVRGALKLDSDFPVAVTDNGTDMQVINESGDPWRWLQTQLRRNGRVLCTR